MNPARIVYEDAPAFIPVPVELRHCRVEAIFWPLDDQATHATVSTDALLPSLEAFRKQLPPQGVSAAEFCRAMRDEDRY